ncbi:glycosyltransferase family 22 protein [Sistotremastrum niveocremeum HHB9708]|uniref:Mannosyltransferase n=1 Tax=Sistotremastrum niveocremeum HHB9708 TaxID=1314777 RepID=A0A164UK74_9AGAM|nr:glycosyltransferase family 22 protein [Sistotremastrum niveocremeum HHB9708]
MAFRLLLLVRVSAAMYSNIQDFFNFWEPLHYLHHGTGFQTWELSPIYAIRSWAYILVHLGPVAAATRLLTLDKRFGFFTLRIVLAVISSYSEATFYRTVVDHISDRVGRYMFFMLLTSAGMWNASTAFLPSSFAMYTTTLAVSFAFRAPSAIDGLRTLGATVWFAVGAIWGWPFSLALAIPFVFEEIFMLGFDRVSPENRLAWSQRRLRRLTRCGLAALLTAVPVIAIDSLAYGKLVFVPWNIVKYNVMGGAERGPHLYGTSPWHFYLLNLLLNFNAPTVAALVSLPALYITSIVDRKRLGLQRPAPDQGSPFLSLAMRLAPFYLWFTVMSLQPHKEERFMYPVYPLLCFNASITIYLVRGWLEVFYVKVTSSPYRAAKSSIFSSFTFSIVVLSSLLSISRIMALNRYYHAPLELAHYFEAVELHRLMNVTGLMPPTPVKQFKYTTVAEDFAKVDVSTIRIFNLSICYGQEWYRFPGHYLTPEGVEVNFVKSGFDGLLPRHFDASIGNGTIWKHEKTREIPTELNDLNVEEPSHYVDFATCDYFVHAFFDRSSTKSFESWDRVHCVPFLDAEATPTLARTLWLPGDWWKSKGTWGEYCLLREHAHAEQRESQRWGAY